MVTTLKIGLINIPIMLVNYSNNRYSTSGLHQFSACCSEAVGNKKYCKGCGKELTSIDIRKGTDKDTILSEEQVENLKEYLEGGIMEVLGIKDCEQEFVFELMPFVQKSQLILPSISKGYKKTDIKVFYSFTNALRDKNKLCLVKYVSRGLEHLGILTFHSEGLVFMEIPFKNYNNIEEIKRLKEAVVRTIKTDKISDLETHKEQAIEYISKFKGKEEDLDLVKEEKLVLLKNYIKDIEKGITPTIKQRVEETNPFAIK